MKVPVVHVDLYDQCLNYEAFTLEDDDGTPVPLTSDGTAEGTPDTARAEIYDPQGGRVLWSANSTDENAQIEITPLSGQIALLPNWTGQAKQIWPDLVHLKIDRYHSNGARVPFAYGTAKLLDE